ncbi:HNH endonuclease [Chitinivorax sp. B]|uniref:HNH endonuclease n=1 Tax=Chitinivorax sp. B TaxID=2502235 RepID=UPI0010F4463D|nr:HNH endonuclease [Chitinivorax sp. B]
MRKHDEAAANLAAGYKRTPEGYVWHNHQDQKLMQLVSKEAHEKTGHDGGFAGR